MTSFFHSVREDIAAVFESDPAARSYLEVLTCYPGLHAVWAHHVSRWFWRHENAPAGQTGLAVRASIHWS